ncbi:MAG: exonuclease domain-containing protein [Cyclobacteriaceae bacterium]|jgi:3'-5' exoribonuclease 1|nr:exonuclease domain-containing protein [Flammeovirgaceae bacterium]
MNYIIFDLEATCWEGFDKSQNETIEIGALKVNDNREIVSEFSSFIKPLKNPILSDFCKQLTSIQQEDVDQAQHFNEVIEKFKEWIDCDSGDYWLCSWGFYDRKQFESDCAIFQLDTTWLNRHINIKQQHGQLRKLPRALGMSNALALEGIKLEGIHHRGIDDARNIAKIFMKYFAQWKYMIPQN